MVIIMEWLLINQWQPYVFAGVNSVMLVRLPVLQIMWTLELKVVGFVYVYLCVFPKKCPCKQRFSF